LMEGNAIRQLVRDEEGRYKEGCEAQ